jgi:transposase
LEIYSNITGRKLMVMIGIDLHSNCFSVCLIYDDGKKVKKEFDLNTVSLKQFYEYLNPETYVLVEASTNTFKFAELIRDKVKAVYVANTHKLKLISMVKKKTDKIDAEKLAIFLKMQITSGEELIKPVYIPEQTVQSLRALFTTYNMLKKQIGQVKNRIHSILKQNLYPFTKEYIFGKNNRNKINAIALEESAKYQIEMLFQELEYLEGKMDEMEDKVKITGEEYYKEINILTSMKGISVVTAIAIIADIGTVERFQNSKHFTSYLRSAPGIDSSNENQRITRTTKFGRELSVVLLSQALNHFRDSNPKLNRWCDKKIEKEKHKKGKIRMALCRKVFSEIYQMLKKKEYHYYRDVENHTEKMKSYDAFLKRNKVLSKIA